MFATPSVRSRSQTSPERRAALALLLACVASVLAWAQPALAARRIALVIGNGAYEQAARLPNPPRDAQAMKQLFVGAGFDDVTLVVDGRREAMTEALRKFARLSDQADVAVLFYAGHGLEIGGENYLVPIDAKLIDERDVKFETIPLAQALDAIDGAAKLKLLLIDACRENPFAEKIQRRDGKRGGARGLAPIAADAGANLLVAYAAAPGQLAADGDGADSPFTTALLKELTAPATEIRVALGGVRDDVVAATGGHQTPYQTGSVGREAIYLGAEPATAPQAPVTPDSDAAARSEFELAKSAGSAAAWDEFLKKHPDGLYAALARAERDKIAAAASDAPKNVFVVATHGSTPSLPSDGSKDCADCPEMVVAPAGRAVLGSPRGEPGRDDRAELDPHEVAIARPFAIGRYDVTFAEWDACVADGACAAKSGDMGFGRGRRPVIFVSWNDAQAYVAWLKKKTGKPYRLPSEAEWEYAARGCATTNCEQQSFWFGEIAPGKAVYDWRFSYMGSPKAYQDGEQTQPVDRGQANPFGLFNVLGNVRQWTLDCWSAAPPPNKSDGAALYRGDCSERVTRGGAWNERPATLRAGGREWAQADDHTQPNLGFRVVKDLD